MTLSDALSIDIADGRRGLSEAGSAVPRAFSGSGHRHTNQQGLWTTVDGLGRGGGIIGREDAPVFAQSEALGHCPGNACRRREPRDRDAFDRSASTLLSPAVLIHFGSRPLAATDDEPAGPTYQHRSGGLTDASDEVWGVFDKSLIRSSRNLGNISRCPGDTDHIGVYGVFSR